MWRARIGPQSCFRFEGRHARKGHVMNMYNFFSFLGLFEELASKKSYAPYTMRTNRFGLHLILKNTCTFKSHHKALFNGECTSGEGRGEIVKN
jgi:hypothetical protein